MAQPPIPFSEQRMTTNHHHTEYAPPVLRAPSPASSVGTTYGQDQTSHSDSEFVLTQPMFEQKWQEKLRLNKPSQEEERANLDPLLGFGQNPAEDELAYPRIVKNLRTAIQELEEMELFEQIIRRGSKIGLEPQPKTENIDKLIESVMDDSLSIITTKEPVTDGPWNEMRPVYEGRGRASMVAEQSSVASTATVGKRSRNGQARKP